MASLLSRRVSTVGTSFMTSGVSVGVEGCGVGEGLSGFGTSSFVSTINFLSSSSFFFSYSLTSPLAAKEASEITPSSAFVPASFSFTTSSPDDGEGIGGLLERLAPE